MKKQRIWLSIVPLLIGLMAFAPALIGSTQGSSVQAARPSPLQNVPITGSIVGGGTFEGAFDIVSFSNVSNQLMANGLLTGTLIEAGGNRREVVNEYVESACHSLHRWRCSCS